ncbi:MAG: DNA mismatch repair protein MutS, partial [Woeseiaceae bacterium]
TLETHQSTEHPQSQLPLHASAAPESSELADALDDIDPDELTPREALDALYRLKNIDS